MQSHAQQKNDKIQLKKVGRQIEHWRNTRTRMGRMPKELWDASVQLAERLSVQVVAKEFGLGYRKLKRLVEHQSPPSKNLVKTPKPMKDNFVEFSPFPLAPNALALNTVFEWSRADGARLTIRIDTKEHQQVSELTHTLVDLIR